MITAKKKAQAIARIKNGESSAEIEAARLGTHKRTVFRWMEAQKVIEKATGAATSSDATPHGETPQEPKNEALEAARKAAGETSDIEEPAPIGTGEIRDAREDMARFCLDTLGQLKMAAGGALVTFRYSPPLDVGSRKVQDLLALGPATTLAVRANCEKIYPVLVKLMSGPFMVWGALAMDGIFMLMGLHRLALEGGWKDPAKAKEAERPAAPEPVLKPVVPPPTADALRPTAAPPPPGTQLEAPVLREAS